MVHQVSEPAQIASLLCNTIVIISFGATYARGPLGMIHYREMLKECIRTWNNLLLFAIKLAIPNLPKQQQAPSSTTRLLLIHALRDAGVSVTH